MNIVLLGSEGYIGGLFQSYLRMTDAKITCFDKNIWGRDYLNDYYEEDVTEWSETLKRAIGKADVIYNLAAIVGQPLCDKIPEETIKINQEFNEQLLNYLNRQRCVVLNTNSSYGSFPGVCTEETPMNPLSLYAKTKDAGEKALLSYDNAVSLRLATVFGAGATRQRFDLLVNNLIWAGFKKKIEVFNGHFRRNYIHIKDVCRGLLHAQSLAPGAYNLGNDELNMTKMELAQEIACFTGMGRSNIVDLGSKIDPDQRDYIVSSQKIKNSGFKCFYNLEDGVGDLFPIFEFNPDADKIESYRNY